MSRPNPEDVLEKIGELIDEYCRDDEPVTFGRTVYPGGRSIEVSSAHLEWTAFAASALNSHEKAVAALYDVQVVLNSTGTVNAEREAAIARIVAAALDWVDHHRVKPAGLEWAETRRIRP